MDSIRPVLVALSILAIDSSAATAAAATATRHANAAQAAEPTTKKAPMDVRVARASSDAAALRVPLAAAGADVTHRRDMARDNGTETAGTAAPSGWLAAFIVVSLIGYQLRRKHRFLRPQRFTL